MNKREGITVGTVATIVIATLMLWAVTQVAYRDWGFVCNNTGSRKGYREWFFGTQTGHWYKPSPLETFMLTNAPGRLQYNWVSSMGTGHNIYGGKVLFGHGRPGPVMHFRHQEMAEWFALIDHREKLAFYDLLVSGNKEAISCKIDAIYDHLVERASTSPR